MADTENVVTFRCGDDLLAEIDAAADSSRFNTRAGFLRWHLEETIGEPYTDASEANRDALAERIDELETQLSDVLGRLEEIERESHEPEPTRIESNHSESQTREQLHESAREREQTHESERAPEPTVDTANVPDTDETTRVCRDALVGWKPGQSLDGREKRREIGVTALEWLRDQSAPKQKGEFVAALYDRTGLEGQGERSWWERLIRPALKQAKANGYVGFEKGKGYHWIGETDPSEGTAG